MANIKEQVVVYKDELYVKGVGGVRDLQDLKDKKSLQDVLKGWDSKGDEDSDSSESSGEETRPQSHPDISTQPSLLPQKFGNYDMYEKLIPISDLVLVGDDLVYPAVYEEKGMIITSCFLLSNDLTMAGIATITRDYFEDGDEILGDKILFSCCDPNYNISWFDYILVQYYIPTNPAYYYDESSEDSNEQSEGSYTDQNV